MKRAVIVHCWGGEPDYAWYPWVAKQLEAQGIAVEVPEMPDAEEPKLKKWLPRLERVIGVPDEDLVLIGHSLGCACVLRYLESLPKGVKVGKVLLVSAFTDQIGYREFDTFFEKPFDFEKIKSKSVEGFIVLQSDDDPYVTEQYGIRLEEELGAELFIKSAVGHMSGPLDEEDSCKELPEVVELVTGIHLKRPKAAKRFRIPRALITSVAGVMVLLVLLAGAVYGYMYYVNKQNNANSNAINTAANASIQQQGETIKPKSPPPNAREGAAVELLTSPVTRGSIATMTVQTDAKSACTIGVAYYKNVPAPASTELGPKVADSFGNVTWDWTVSSSAPIGKGMVKVTCTYNKKNTAVVEGDLQVNP